MSVVCETGGLFCKRVVRTWQSKMASKMAAVFFRSRQKHLVKPTNFIYYDLRKTLTEYYSQCVVLQIHI